MSKRNPCHPKKRKNKDDRKKPRPNIIHRAIVTVDNDLRRIARGLSGI